MRRIKDIVQSGLQDLNNQRKRNRISMILIFFSLVVYIGINSYMNSYEDSINASINFFESRILIKSVKEDDIGKEVELLQKLYGADERVREIVVSTPARTVEWLDAFDILYMDAVRLDIFGAYEAVLDYDYKGEKKLPEKDEIIMPRYLCDIGIYDTKNLGDGDSLIGKTIKLKYESPGKSEVAEYEFKVIGTYDNIQARTSSSLGIVNFEILNEIQKMRNDEDERAEDEIIELLMQETGEELDYEFYRKLFYSIYINEDYDINAFMNEVYEKTGIQLERYKLLDGSLEGYLEYVILIGNLVSGMLLMIAVINIIISSVNEVKDRKWEFALKMSMGYERKDIICTFFVEKLGNFIKALLLAIFVVGVYCVAITHITQNYLEYWKREYIYTIYPENIVVAFILVFMAGMIGTLVGRVSINSINVAKELKAGE